VLAFTKLAIALLIAIIGGPVVPAFTRNRLKTRGDDARDGVALIASAAVALAELLAPAPVSWLARAAAVAHAVLTAKLGFGSRLIPAYELRA